MTMSKRANVRDEERESEKGAQQQQQHQPTIQLPFYDWQ